VEVPYARLPAMHSNSTDEAPAVRSSSSVIICDYSLSWGGPYLPNSDGAWLGIEWWRGAIWSHSIGIFCFSDKDLCAVQDPSVLGFGD
jgi:hypothetical protein